MEDEACLNVLLKWACLQSGDSLKEVCELNDLRMVTPICVKTRCCFHTLFAQYLLQIFNDAEFVGWQGTFRRIAASFISMVAYFSLTLIIIFAVGFNGNRRGKSGRCYLSERNGEKV